MITSRSAMPSSTARLCELDQSRLRLPGHSRGVGRSISSVAHGWHCQRSHRGASSVTSLAHEPRLKIRQPQLVRPLIRAHRNAMAPPVVGAVDLNAADTHCSHPAQLVGVRRGKGLGRRDQNRARAAVNYQVLPPSCNINDLQFANCGSPSNTIAKPRRSLTKAHRPGGAGAVQFVINWLSHHRTLAGAVLM